MIFKLRTSRKTQVVFEMIQKSQAMAPYILAKIAIALSLNSDKDLLESDFKSDNNGIELNRQTITGEYDILFKALTIVKEKKKISDDDFFPKYVKAHLDRGALMLESEYRYGGNFVEHLANLDLSI